jgi:hypothetical protein
MKCYPVCPFSIARVRVDDETLGSVLYSDRDLKPTTPDSLRLRTDVLGTGIEKEKDEEEEETTEEEEEEKQEELLDPVSSPLKGSRMVSPWLRRSFVIRNSFSRDTSVYEVF